MENCQTFLEETIRVYKEFVILCLFIVLCIPPVIAGSTLFQQGEKYFLNNQPKKAVQFLEASLKDDSGNYKTYIYLGIAYEQLKLYKKAIDTYQRGIKKIKDHHGLMYTNIGNNYIRLGESQKAIDSFSQALSIDSSDTTALRNRAGEYLRLGRYNNALSDYKLYLMLDPAAYQKEEIQKVINLLEGTLSEIAQKKLEEERKRLEKEKKQQELLDKVLNSLSKASNDTTNLSAGTGKIEQYSDSYDIVE